MIRTALTLLLAAGMTSAVAARQAPAPSSQPQAVVTAQPPTMPPTAPARMAPSPRGTAATQVAGQWIAEKPGAEPRYRDGKWITVDSGRPILRGRQDVFGSGSEYGKKVNGGSPLWRAGANQTTRFSTEVPLVIVGKKVPAGDYSLFVELKEGAWTLVLSTQPAQAKYDPKDKAGTWGSDNYEAKFDVARVPMKLSMAPHSVDQLTFAFIDMTQAGGTLALEWGKELATVDFKVGQ